MNNSNMKLVHVLCLTAALVTSAACGSEEVVEDDPIALLEQLYDEEVAVVMAAVDAYRAENPDASEAEVEEYLTEQLRQALDVRPDRADVNIPGARIQLNDLERAICDENPAACITFLGAGVEAKNHAKVVFRDATKPPTQQDALRHTYWNALMTLRLNQQWAKRFADAHENGYRANDPVETEMDFYNNEKGRIIGATWAPHGHATITREVKAFVCRGDALIVNAAGTATVRSNTYGPGLSRCP